MARLPETTRIARVLDIISYINAAPKQWTRKRLAERFEVSERAITKDIELIRHGLKLPIESERGRGYSFREAPRLPSVVYSIPEALALLQAADLALHVPGIPRQGLMDAIDRLAAVIPPELRAL